MASFAAPGPNVYSTVAAQFSQVYTEEQKLFQEALSNVSTKRKAGGSLPKVFGLLNQAKTLAGLSQVIDQERNASAVWKETKGKTWLKIVSDFASKLLQCKDAVGLIVSASMQNGSTEDGGLHDVRSHDRQPSLGCNSVRASCMSLQMASLFGLTQYRW